MKRILLSVWAVSMVFSSWTANASNSDASFVRKFNSYKAKHKISAYRAAKAFANHHRKNPEQILKRYISAAYAIGGPSQEAAVVHGIDAFKESGLSHEMALTKVSDMVGQMTETLDAIYQREAGNRIAAPARAGRGLASVRSR